MKTTLGSELSVAIDLENRAIRDYEDRAATNPLATSEVISIMFSPEVKGYVFVETMHPDRVFYLARGGIKNYKGMVEGEIRQRRYCTTSRRSLLYRASSLEHSSS